MSTMLIDTPITSVNRSVWEHNVVYSLHDIAKIRRVSSPIEELAKTPLKLSMVIRNNCISIRVKTISLSARNSRVCSPHRIWRWPCNCEPHKDDKGEDAHLHFQIVEIKMQKRRKSSKANRIRHVCLGTSRWPLAGRSLNGVTGSMNLKAWKLEDQNHEQQGAGRSFHRATEETNAKTDVYDILGVGKTTYLDHQSGRIGMKICIILFGNWPGPHVYLQCLCGWGKWQIPRPWRPVHPVHMACHPWPII